MRIVAQVRVIELPEAGITLDRWFARRGEGRSFWAWLAVRLRRGLA
jgi:hypothetical protein